MDIIDRLFSCLTASVATCALAWTAAHASPATAAPDTHPKIQVELGIDVLLAPGSPQIAALTGKRIGLITNPSGVDGRLVPTADRLARDPRVKLVQLYGPEHGIRGEVPAGDPVEDARDPVTGLPVQSI